MKELNQRFVPQRVLSIQQQDQIQCNCLICKATKGKGDLCISFYSVFCYPYIYSSHITCINTDKLRILPRIREGQVILGPLQSICIWLNEECLEGTIR